MTCLTVCFALKPLYEKKNPENQSSKHDTRLLCNLTNLIACGNHNKIINKCHSRLATTILVVHNQINLFNCMFRYERVVRSPFQ